jgi:hypothetical protein
LKKSSEIRIITHSIMLLSDTALLPLISSTRNTPKLYTSLCMEKFMDSFALVMQKISIKVKQWMPINWYY